jgi:hypothetical protein
MKIGPLGFIRQKYDPETWEPRFKEPIWQLKEFIEWISQPEEWGVCLPKFIPDDMEAYRKRLHQEALSGLKEGLLKMRYDAQIDDYLVVPVQILLFFQIRNFHLPKLCSTFLASAH